jgi:hypothetical protein
MSSEPEISFYAGELSIEPGAIRYNHIYITNDISELIDFIISDLKTMADIFISGEIDVCKLYVIDKNIKKNYDLKQFITYNFMGEKVNLSKNPYDNQCYTNSVENLDEKLSEFVENPDDIEVKVDLSTIPIITKIDKFRLTSKVLLQYLDNEDLNYGFNDLENLEINQNESDEVSPTLTDNEN